MQERYEDNASYFKYLTNECWHLYVVLLYGLFVIMLSLLLPIQLSVSGRVPVTQSPPFSSPVWLL